MDDLVLLEAGFVREEVAGGDERGRPGADRMMQEQFAMKPNQSNEDTRNRRRHALHDAEGMASGAMVGAFVGAAAGPPGMIAGAVMGAFAGGVAAMALDSEADKHAAHEEELDEEIGVTGGDLGAPNLKHPPVV